MTSLKEMGEFGLIKQIVRWNGSVSAPLGIGDDTAILRIHPKKDILFTTDMLIQDKHFRLEEATPYEIGWKAMAVNISDIAAMGGKPTYAVVSAGFHQDTATAFIKEIYRGMKAVMKKFGVELVGGDTNRSEKLILSVTLLGEAPKGKAILRSGAKPGDVIFVTGELGGSYQSKKHLSFTPRIKEAQFLMQHFHPTAMMDISDGLASDLQRLTKASHVGAFLLEEAIPVSSHAKKPEDALTDGEDFELLFTLSPKDAARLTIQNDIFYSPVGKIAPRSKGVCLISMDGRVRELKSGGFDHFKQ